MQSILESTLKQISSLLNGDLNYDQVAEAKQLLNEFLAKTFGENEKENLDRPGLSQNKRPISFASFYFPYEHFGNREWPMRYDFEEKSLIINADHISEDDGLLVNRAIAPFEHIPEKTVAENKARILYKDISAFARNLSTMCKQDDAKLPMALKTLFKSKWMQREMHSVVELKERRPNEERNMNKQGNLNNQIDHSLIKDNSFLVVKVGNQDRPACLADIEQVRDQFADALRNEFPDLPILVTHHAVEVELHTTANK